MRGAPRAIRGIGAALLAIGSVRAGAQIDVLEQLVVVVNGEPVTKTSIDERIRVTRALGGQPGDTDVVAILPRILSDAIDEILIVQRARELGLTVAEADVDGVIATVRSQTGASSDEQFAQLLDREGITAVALRTSVRRQLTIELVRQRTARDVTVTELEAERYFEKNRDRIGKERTVTYRELCLKVPPPEAVADIERDAAIVRVVRIGDRIASGADFIELVRTFSEEPSRDAAGLVGPTGLSALPSTIADALRALRPGQVSGPVTAPGRYCFVRLESEIPPTPRTFRANRGVVMQQLLAERQRAAFEALLNRLRAAAFLQWKRADYRALYEQAVSYR